jgi:hypothetical protein
LGLDSDRLRARIHEHLTEEVAKGDDARLLALTLRGIAEAVQERDRQRIRRALKKLEEGDDILKEDAPLRIFVPTSDEGRAVLGRFAREGYVGFSPWVAAACGFILAILAIAFVRTTNPTEIVDQAPTQAYWNGVIAGGIMGGVATLAMGRLLWEMFAAYRRSRVGWEEQHARIVTPVKYAANLSVGLVLLYWVAWVYPGRGWDLGHVLALVALSVALAFPLARALREK